MNTVFTLEQRIANGKTKLRNSGQRACLQIPITRVPSRAARAMLMWSVRQLAQQSGISESSIRRIEAEFGVPENVTLDLLMRLREFYEGKGFRFTFDDEDGPGVTWRRKERRRCRSPRGRRIRGSLDHSQQRSGIEGLT
jgi:transcriptional regulator with XRE-family HTH domain